MSFVNYVLDTSVLLSAGKNALYSFPNSNVIIPLVVLEELEKKRSDPELGIQARSVLVALDELRAEGDLKQGIWLKNNARVRIELNHITNVPEELKNRYNNDARILTVAYGLGKDLKDEKVLLVSKDLPMKVLASLVGVKSSDFTPTNLKTEHIDEIGVEYVASEEIDKLYETGTIRLDLDVPRNVGVNLRANDREKHTALVIARGQYEFELVTPQTISGLESKSKEQALAIKYLLDDSIKLVSLGGRAGTGKTTLALAAGLEQVLDPKTDYKKVTVFRSMQAVGGEELGFLPGTEAEKLDPWTAAIYDSLESFIPKERIATYKAKGLIEVLPLTHLRGRNLAKRFIVIDEAQNLEKSVIMTAITRSGKGTKVVMSWDVSQRDNLRVGRHDGVYEVVSRLMGEKLFAHVSLQKSERSDLAELVSRKLDDFEM